MCIDPGTKKMGVAISDLKRTIAFPRGIFEFSQTGINKIFNIIDTENVAMILIGAPLYRKKNSINDIAMQIFRKSYPALEIKFINEDFSSIEAKNKILDRRKDEVDDIAAQIILNRYLRTLE